MAVQKYYAKKIASFLKFVYPEDRDSFTANVKRERILESFAQGRPHVLDFRIMKSDKTYIYYQMRFVPIRNDVGTAEEKNIRFVSTLDSSIEHHWIYADRLRMMRVLTNIISNSVKYTNPGGRIELLAEEIPCDKEGYARYRYTVSDTGIGMSGHIAKPIDVHELFDVLARILKQ